MIGTQGTDAVTHLEPKHGSNVEPKTDMDPSISKLRQLNNALSIHQLPIELLLSIFEWVLRKADTALAYYDQVCALSGVCARWLFIIHHSPQLWTTVAGSIQQEGLRSVLERSSDNLIDIEYEDYYWRYDEVHFLDLLGSANFATRRWRSLVLGDNHYPKFRPRDFLQFPAPNLERLVFKDQRGWGMEDLELFGGNCPKLKHIHLERGYWQWSQATFKALESLKLFEVFFGSLEAILDMIRDSPQLETLEICSCRVREELPADAQQVTLPNLQFLRVELESYHGFAWATQDLLDHISAPPQCPLYISGATTKDDEDPLEDSLAATFCEWLFGRQTREVLEGVESFKLGFDIDESSAELDGSVTYELFSSSASIKGGIRKVGLGDLRYVQEYIQGLFQRSSALQTFTTLRLSGRAAEVLSNSELANLLREVPPIPHLDVPPITHLELVKPTLTPPEYYREHIFNGVIFRITSAFQMMKNLSLRGAPPNGILEMVLGVLGDPQAHTQPMFECQVEHLNNVEIHVEQEEFNKLKPVVEVLRNDSRIGKVDVYVAL